VRKRKRKINRTLATYKKNQAHAKGKLFEMVLKELMLKAGFSTSIDSDQVTKNKKRLHGRGATYDPDFFGKFRLGIPFVNPLMIVAEAKYFNSKVKLKNVREFLGAFIDFSQYVKIDTKAAGEKRYSILHSTRYTYCPVFFSVKGYELSAQGFMFAHGINYISYENSEIIAKVNHLMDQLMKRIKFSKFIKGDFKHFEDINALSEIREALRKKDFEKSYVRFKNYLTKVNSLIGVVDQKYPVNILYRRKIKASMTKKIRLKINKKNVFFIENVGDRKLGEFSLSEALTKGYVNYAKKNNSLDKIFTQIDIIYSHNENIEIKQLIVEEESRKQLINELMNHGNASA